MKILRAYGIPEEIVKLIESLYTRTRAKVRTADGLTSGTHATSLVTGTVIMGGGRP